MCGYYNYFPKDYFIKNANKAQKSSEDYKENQRLLKIKRQWIIVILYSILIATLIISSIVDAKANECENPTNYEYQTKITNVVDGDTVDATLQLGFNITFTDRFRLYGINAPETRTKDTIEKVKGMASKLWLKHQINTAQTITIRTLKDKRGKFGRWLAILCRNNEPKSLNEQMLDNGLAIEYMRD